MNFDTIIKNVQVYDGRGNKPYIADVGLKGDVISSIGSLSDSSGVCINGNGLALSPGFIDMHTHDDIPIILDPYIQCKLMQGVTTSVVGCCGSGIIPFTVAEKHRMQGLGYKKLPAEWSTHSEYMNYLDNEPASLNVVLFAGHNTFRSGIIGEIDRKANDREIEAMKKLFCEGIEAGIHGLSSGLYYVPGCYADAKELIALAKCMTGTDCIYTSHIRDEADHIINSIQEAADIGEAANIPVQISHIKCEERKNWGRANEVLNLINELDSRTGNISMDLYPYTAASTSLRSILRGATQYGNNYDGLSVPPGDLLIVSSLKFPEYSGLTIKDISEKYNKKSKNIAESILQKEDVTVVHLNDMSEDDVCTFMKHPKTMIGSDGLHTKSGNPHPRLFGTFPRVLGRYSKEMNIIPLETAIYKMTGLSAEKLKLKNRGVIEEGAYADLVLFNPEKIIDKATFINSKVYPEGINDVFVNGTRVIENGQHTGSRPGKVLRK
jgi:N-acyl-D-amino-acid deacylase